MQLDFLRYIAYELAGDTNLSPEGIESERENAFVFYKSGANPMMKKLKYVSVKYEGDERTQFNKEGDEKDSSYRILLLARIATNFDSWVVLNSLDKVQK